jgi:protein-tyrosine phosphatase
VVAASNTRDLGGLRATGRDRVRSGLWYRGSAAGMGELHAQRRLRTVLDLRSAQEIERNPLNVPGAEIRVRPIEVSRDVLRSSYGPQPSHYLAYYRQLTGPALMVAAELVSLLGQARQVPVAVCCAAGKDRTAVVCALTLRAIGVRIADIAADHELTFRLLRSAGPGAAAEWARSQDPALIDRRIVTTAQTMHNLLTGLDKTHGDLAELLIARGLGRSALSSARATIITSDIDRAVP